MPDIRITSETITELRLMGVQAANEIRDRLAACGSVSEIEGRLVRAYSLGYLAGKADAEK